MNHAGLHLRTAASILALPVDGRPVVRQQVVDLVTCAGWRLQVPAVEQLGHFREPADRDVLADWLITHAAQAQGFVLSLDMLLYGGLVPSRFIDDPLPALQDRLQILRRIRQRHPDKPLYAFAATMRISNNDVAEEEKAYWAHYGRLIWSWSYHLDRAEQTGDGHSQALADEAAAAIPAEVRTDYRATRRRNFLLVCEALELVAKGMIDRLALPQDDTAEFGFNIAERRQLQARAHALGVADRVHICPGADEVLHTLCAHLVARLMGHPLLRVEVCCSDPNHIDSHRALYEDRPMLQSLAGQLAAVGAVKVEAGDAGSVPDVLLALHTQGTEQGDWAMGCALPQRPGIQAAWWHRIESAMANGIPVALADCAFANGGDPELLADPRLSPSQLFSYAAWNTASNRLGGLLAHAALARGRWWSEASSRVRALRLLEDGQYQAVWRQALRDRLGGPQQEAALAPGALQAQAQACVLPRLQAWAEQQGLGYRLADIRFPWNRSFEADLVLEAVA